MHHVVQNNFWGALRWDFSPVCKLALWLFNDQWPSTFTRVTQAITSSCKPPERSHPTWCTAEYVAPGDSSNQTACKQPTQATASNSGWLSDLCAMDMPRWWAFKAPSWLQGFCQLLAISEGYRLFDSATYLWNVLFGDTHRICRIDHSEENRKSLLLQVQLNALAQNNRSRHWSNFKDPWFWILAQVKSLCTSLKKTLKLFQVSKSCETPKPTKKT